MAVEEALVGSKRSKRTQHGAGLTSWLRERTHGVLRSHSMRDLGSKPRERTDGVLRSHRALHLRSKARERTQRPPIDEWRERTHAPRVTPGPFAPVDVEATRMHANEGILPLTGNARDG